MQPPLDGTRLQRCEGQGEPVKQKDQGDAGLCKDFRIQPASTGARIRKNLGQRHRGGHAAQKPVDLQSHDETIPGTPQAEGGASLLRTRSRSSPVEPSIRIDAMANP